MAKAGTVTLELDANSVKMMRELQRAENRTRRSSRNMMRDMRRAFNQIGRAAAGASAAVAAATAAIVRQQSRQIDAMAKTSDQLGIAIESFQALELAAEMSGVASTRLVSALERMQRRLGQVARDGGPAARALEDMGIQIDDLLDLSPDQQFQVLSEALVGIESATVRASVAMDIFGRDGQQLLGLMRQLSSQGIGALQDDLEALGVALTREGAAKVEMMNDAMTVLQRVARGAGQTLTVELAPFVQAVADGLTDAARASGGFREQIVSAIESVVNSLAFLADTVVSVQRVFQVWGRTIALVFADAQLGVLRLADAIVNGPNRAINAFLGLAQRVPGIDFEFTFPEALDLSDRIDQARRVVEEGRADIQDILMQPLPSSGVERRLDAIREQSGRDAREIASNVQNAARGTREALEFIELEDREKLLPRFEEMLAQADEASSHFDEFGRQAARNIQDHFASFLFDPFEDGVRGMVRGFVDAIRQMIAQAAASQILGAMFGGFAGSGGFLGSIAGGFGGARADGGPVSRGKSFLVGERGPELFVPGSSGSIVPNEAMGGVNVTINAPGADEGTFARMVTLVESRVVPQAIQAATQNTLNRIQRPRFA